MIIQQAEFKKLKYVISYPDDYKEKVQYPIIFYTHGAGSRGNDLSLLNIDVPIKKNVSANDFIIIAPQCYANTWFEIFEQLIEFCEFVYNQPFTDKSRFYASGVSMGGYAIYQLIMSRQKLFTAGIVCCGGGMYWNAGRLANVPVWAFHGEKDKSVFVTESINMVDAVNRKGGNAKLTVYPETGHASWVETYANPEVFTWLLQHENQNDQEYLDGYTGAATYG